MPHCHTVVLKPSEVAGFSHVRGGSAGFSRPTTGVQTFGSGLSIASHTLTEALHCPESAGYGAIRK